MRRTLARVGLGLVLLAAGGCATSEAPPAGERGPGLFAWTPLPEPTDVLRFRERLARHQDAPASLAALVADAPDLAHALYLIEEEAERRLELTRALAAQSAAYLASARARAAAPAEHDAARARLREAWSRLRNQPGEARAAAADAAGRLEELDDPVLAAQARLLGAAAAIEAGDPPSAVAAPGDAPPPTLAAQAAFLTLGAAYEGGEAELGGVAAEARRRALAVPAWSLLARLEELRSFDVGGLDGADLHAWWTALAGVALDRGRWLEAVGPASRALEWSEAHDPARVAADRLLLARAFLGAGRAEPARREAAAAAAAATAPLERARAEALRGQALLGEGQSADAVEAFAAAEALAVEAGDAEARARYAVNQAVALLERGDARAARAALEAVAARAAASPEVEARAAVTAAVADLVAGEAHAEAAAGRVAAALERARRAGAYRVVEDYAGLAERIRSGRGR